MIKFLLIALCIYLILKWVVGPMLRIFLQNYLKGVVEKHGYQGPPPRNQHRRADGTIHVDYIPKSSKVDKKNDQEGEYIDYEEVK